MIATSRPDSAVATIGSPGLPGDTESDPARREKPSGEEQSTSRAIRALSLRRNSLWNALGLAVTAICQWGALVALARLGRPEMIGQYTLGLAVTAPIVLFANLQLRSVQVLDIHRRDGFGDLLSLRLLTTGIALAVIVIVSVLGGYRSETALVVVAVGLTKAVDAISDLLQGLYQQCERMDWIAWSQILKSVLGVLALAGTVAWTGSMLYGTLAMTGVLGLCLLLYDLPTAARVLASRDRGELSPRWNPTVLVQIARKALPYGIVIMLVSLTFNIPRYTIQRTHGEAALGIFSAMAYVLVVVATLNSALGQAAFPRLARDHAEGRMREYHALLARLIGLGLAFGAVGIVAALVAGPRILTLLYGPSFADRNGAMVVIMIVAAVMAVASPLNFGMVAAGYRKLLIPLYGTAVLAAELASRWFIPQYGSTGAALAFLATYGLQVAGSLGILVHDAMRFRKVQQPPPAVRSGGGILP